MKTLNLSLLLISYFVICLDAGIIKDIFQKVTNTNNKTEETVKQSAPICGSGIFSTFNKSNVSPELIFITNRASQSEFADERSLASSEQSQSSPIREVAREFRFNVDNVTLDELIQNGFNPDAPVTFLIHGFTSGYPLQAWMSAIVESYTIDRETTNGKYESSYNNQNYGSGNLNQNQNQNGYPNYGTDNSNYNQGYNSNNYNSNSNSGFNNQRDRDINLGRNKRDRNSASRGKPMPHNLFIINWNYAARGIVYPRAVANIPIVATYATRFINDKLIGEAGIESRRIQLIGHSLGAQMAGFIGKNTRSKLGRIYGLDPAGPCFGTISGPLYPSSKRLAPDDAEEVITVQTNTVLLGIDKPLGKYSVFVEGGEVQPGCKGGGVLKSFSALTWDGGDFDTVACSHSRAPNLLTYRHDQSHNDDCQMVAYECKDWEAFKKGQCGICQSQSSNQQLNNQYGDQYSNDRASRRDGPFRPVECIRIGLDWQYPKKSKNSKPGNSWSQSSGSSFSSLNNNQNTGTSYENSSGYNDRETNNNYNQSSYTNGGRTTTRPYQSGGSSGYTGLSSFSNDRDRDSEGYNSGQSNLRNSTRRPTTSSSSFNQRNRRGLFSRSSSNSTSDEEERRGSGDKKTHILFLRTGDTQPYCTYHYQVILELNEPFPKKNPPMSILVQDSQNGRSDLNSRSGQKQQQNSITNDEFGHMYDDRTYTHLITSGKKLKKVDLATLLFRNGLPEGKRILKSISFNYMSNNDPRVRSSLSSKLCLVDTDTDRDREMSANHRFYFRPCDGRSTQNQRSPNQSGATLQSPQRSSELQKLTGGNQPTRRP